MTEAARDEPERLSAGKDSPHLEQDEREQAARHARPAARVIHEVLREEGEAELARPVGALLWSGLAAGLSMGFSFLTMALLSAGLRDAPARETISAVGYCVGFVIAVLAKQQLFTETTLTASLPLLHRPSLAGARRLARMWAIVLVANLAGTIVFAWLVSRAGVFDGEVRAALEQTARGAFASDIGSAMLRAILAGWLIALMVWLLPSSGSAAPFVIALLTFVVALARFPHVIAGSTEAAFAVMAGDATPRDYLLRFLAPTLAGNLIGGTALAALLNHAPVAHDFADRDAGAEGASGGKADKGHAGQSPRAPEPPRARIESRPR